MSVTICSREIRTLSGGERARITIALMALSRAHLLILDDPTNHLAYSSNEPAEEARRTPGSDPFGADGVGLPAQVHLVGVG
jgi:hypothetical protein